MIWVKGLPFKIAFFMWKVWKNKIPLDDFLRRLGYLMASRCWCCLNPKEETMSHVFFSSYTTKRVWNYFLSCAGISLENLSFHQSIVPHKWPDLLNMMEVYTPKLKVTKVI